MSISSGCVVRAWLVIRLFAVVHALVGCSEGMDAHRADNGTELYLNKATLVDVTRGALITDRALWLKSGRIAGIYPSDQAAPNGVRQISLEGAFISPGLVDMHVHLHDIKELSTNLAYGVTTVRNLNGFPAHLRWRQRVAQGDWPGATLITASPSIAVLSAPGNGPI